MLVVGRSSGLLPSSMKRKISPLIYFSSKRGGKEHDRRQWRMKGENGDPKKRSFLGDWSHNEAMSFLSEMKKRFAEFCGGKAQRSKSCEANSKQRILGTARGHIVICCLNEVSSVE